MLSISYDTAKQNRLIRFRSPGSFFETRDAFYIKDGDRIRITSGYDGKVTSHVCEYIDPTHFRVSHAVFHMDQFSEVMGKNGSSYEPETPITDLSFFETKYCDRALVDETGKRIPYHEVLTLQDTSRSDKPQLSISICPRADALCTVCLTEHKNGAVNQTFMSFKRLYSCISEELYSILNQWDRRALYAILCEHYPLTKHPSLKNRMETAVLEATTQNKERHTPVFEDHSR